MVVEAGSEPVGQVLPEIAALEGIGAAELEKATHCSLQRHAPLAETVEEHLE